MQPPAEARDHARPARQMLSSAYSGRSLLRPQQGCVRAAAGPPQATLVRGIRGQDEDVRRTRDPAPQRSTNRHACPRHATRIPVRPYAGTRARYAFRSRRSAPEYGGVQPPAQITPTTPQLNDPHKKLEAGKTARAIKLICATEQVGVAPQPSVSLPELTSSPSGFCSTGCG